MALPQNLTTGMDASKAAGILALAALAGLCLMHKSFASVRIG